jgi:adenylate kinase
VHLASAGTPIDGVVSPTADEDEVAGRLLRRAKIEGRVDDTEETIRKRQQVYAEQTAPLIDI